jgi:hypothetical protein
LSAQDPGTNPSAPNGVIKNLDEYNYSTGGEFLWLTF